MTDCSLLPDKDSAEIYETETKRLTKPFYGKTIFQIVFSNHFRQKTTCKAVLQ